MPSPIGKTTPGRIAAAPFDEEDLLQSFPRQGRSREADACDCSFQTSSQQSHPVGVKGRKAICVQGLANLISGKSYSDSALDLEASWAWA